MKSRESPRGRSDPGFIVEKGDALSLSGGKLKELLRSVLDRGASFRFRARGSSMHPFIMDKDVITVAPLRRRRPGLGMVAAFIHPETGNVGIHRIVGRRSHASLIKGDNNPGEDGLVSRADILGCVTGLERKGREVRFGLGPERILISFLSRLDLLRALWTPARKVARLIATGGEK